MKLKQQKLHAQLHLLHLPRHATYKLMEFYNTYPRLIFTLLNVFSSQAAVYGRDPNWGRIACAAGYAGIPFNPNKLRISLGDTLLMDCGQPLPFDSVAASNYMRKAGETHGTVEVHISIGDGRGSGVAWGCDLSYDYVKINAEYTT
nr:arginine biosynthesis bifunctional protein ArgJ, chloroplastic isoform X2 [Ipomoea batatas]